MSNIDAWLLAVPAEWDALGTPEASFSYTWSQAITGYWLPSGFTEVYNVVGTEADIQEIIDALTTTPITYSWVQGTGDDNLDVWPTDPAPILALMKPHIIYDINGNPVGSTPATQQNPNWGHVFFGQKERIFAGTFDAAFSGAYL
jgi:hypothetical protein